MLWPALDAHAEAVNLTAGAPDLAASAAVPAPPFGEPALDDWASSETGSIQVRELTEETQSDLLSQPYHSRSPSWIQSATDLHLADTERLKSEAAREERDRRTIQWLLEEDDQRHAQALAASSPQAILERRLRALAPVADGPSQVQMPTGVRTATIVAAFGLFVTVTLLALKFRPHRHRRHGSRASTPNDESSQRRRRRRRRRSSAGSELVPTPTPTPEPVRLRRRRSSKSRRSGHSGSSSRHDPGRGRSG